jgi:hypothetical protein
MSTFILIGKIVKWIGKIHMEEIIDNQGNSEFHALKFRIQLCYGKFSVLRVEAATNGMVS